MNASIFFAKRSRIYWITAGLAFIIVLGVIDYLSGYEVSLSLFYLIPIFGVVWFVDGRMGLAFSFASTMAWFFADYVAGLSYTHPSIYIWNSVLRLCFYFVVTWLGTTLKKTYRINQELARTDYVTGAASIRYFYELARIELSRSERSRQPFSLAYIDLDNFKAVNDCLGHSTGDQVLRAVTTAIRSRIRPTDTFARLGGDEFALLLPETGADTIKATIDRLHTYLLEEMCRNNWMVTFSLGVVTYNQIPNSVDEMVQIADQAMYSVKIAGKNGANYCIHTG